MGCYVLIHSFLQPAIVIQGDNCNRWVCIKSWGTKKKKQLIASRGVGTVLREGKLELGRFIMSTMPRDPCEKRWEDKRTLQVEKISPGLREWILPWRGNCGKEAGKGGWGQIMQP